MLIDCPTMTQYRESCNLGMFIKTYRRISPQMSSVKIYALYLNDTHPITLKEKAIDLYHMKIGWHIKMKIEM